MAFLHNRVSQKELKAQLLQDKEARTTLSFYRYFTIKDPPLFRDFLYAHLQQLSVLGRIYVAHEGINAQVSVPAAKHEVLKKFLNSVEGLADLRLNVAMEDDGKSFWVLKIKVREKIVADGIEDPAFSMEERGKYVDAEQFNALTADPETVVVDMRNHYEYEVGHFQNAIEVPSDTFREQLPMAAGMLREAKDKNIIMYCTGGIRCEKASAYMLHQGFKNVYHLEGGIIHYAQQVKDKGLLNNFRGKNFVFDNRLGERISDEIIATCHQCGAPADTHVNCANEACHLLFIQCEACRQRHEGCCSTACRQVIHLPEEEQKALRRGIDKGQHVFNKARQRKPALGAALSAEAEAGSDGV
jgi:UPF0176 protein